MLFTVVSDSKGRCTRICELWTFIVESFARRMHRNGCRFQCRVFERTWRLNEHVVENANRVVAVLVFIMYCARVCHFIGRCLLEFNFVACRLIIVAFLASARLNLFPHR